MDQLPERIDLAQRPEEALASRQFTAGLEEKLAQLPERQREALSLCAFEGLGNIEAAEVMGISVRALESLLARGRRTLRTRLNEAKMEGETS